MIYQQILLLCILFLVIRAEEYDYDMNIDLNFEDYLENHVNGKSPSVSTAAPSWGPTPPPNILRYVRSLIHCNLFQ